MVQIPQHKSDAQIKVSGGQLAGGGAIASSKRAQAGAISAIEQAQDRLLQIKDFRQTSEANAFVFEELNKAKQRSQTDNDMDISVYDNEFQKIGSDAAKNISGQLARDEFMVNFNRQAQATKWGIENDFRAREISSAIAVQKYTRGNIVENYPTMDEAGKISSTATYKQQIERGMTLGLYSKEVADIEWKSFQEDVYKSEAAYDAQYDPNMFLENTEDYQVGEEEMKKMKGMASEQQKKIKQEEKRIRKETHQNNAISVVSQMVKPDGSLPSVNDINSMMGNDDLSQDFAKAYSKATTSSKLTREKAEFDDTGFQSYAMDVFDSKDSEQIQQAIINTLNGGGDGRVNQDELVTLLQLSMMREKEIKNGDDNMFSKIGKSITNLSVLGAAYNTQKILYEYSKKVAEGKEPLAAKNEAEMEVISEKNLELTSVDGEGTLMMDDAGNKAIVYPDGRIEEVK